MLPKVITNIFNTSFYPYLHIDDYVLLKKKEKKL